jgi:hypothetical protein
MVINSGAETNLCVIGTSYYMLFSLDQSYQIYAINKHNLLDSEKIFIACFEDTLTFFLAAESSFFIPAENSKISN